MIVADVMQFHVGIPGFHIFRISPRNRFCQHFAPFPWIVRYTVNSVYIIWYDFGMEKF